MSYCLNPICSAPQNSDAVEICQTCGTNLLLQNRYVALEPIAQGGFGKTFLAVDRSQVLKPRCVIKQFLPQPLGTATQNKAADLFRQEAQRLQELGKHPQIPALLAYLEQDGRQYLIQEFIDGCNLAQILNQEGTFNEAQIWQLLADLLPVLQFMHDRQVIHRDIKPENIIRDRSTQKLFLVDLGAAKYATGTALARTGTLIGSAEYTAPEQTRGKAVFASDLYSLGATCIHLLTQLSPFDLYDNSEGQWIWQSYLSDGVSCALDRLLSKLLASATNQRYRSAAEVLLELEAEAQPQNPSLDPEAWDVIAEKTAYQLSLHLSFAEAGALKSATGGAIVCTSPRSRVQRSRQRSQSGSDWAFPVALLVMTLPIFSWCISRVGSPPPPVLHQQVEVRPKLVRPIPSLLFRRRGGEPANNGSVAQSELDR